MRIWELDTKGGHLFILEWGFATVAGRPVGFIRSVWHHQNASSFRFPSQLD